MKKVLLIAILLNLIAFHGIAGEPPTENGAIDQTELNEGMKSLDSQIKAMNAQIEEQQQKLQEEQLKSYNEQNLKNLNEFVAKQDEVNRKKKRSNYIRAGLLLVMAVSFIISRISRKKAKDASQRSED